jgi:hypothetical protein
LAKVINDPKVAASADLDDRCSTDGNVRFISGLMVIGHDASLDARWSEGFTRAPNLPLAAASYRIIFRL